MAFSVYANMIGFKQIMKRLLTFVIISLISCLATAMLYRPISIAIFTLTEPYFEYPIRLDSGKGMIIRSDAGGDGEFAAKRLNGRSHTGMDIQAPLITPVRASKSGLAFCLNVPTGYGKYILIHHPDGYQTLYAHLSEWNIISAHQVKRGDIIGFVGKSGNANRKNIEPHLHFEIRKNNEPQDPQKLMRSP
jgi:murein DD-endopeptidase MepM/ murein hydrolase activator NlpD